MAIVAIRLPQFGMGMSDGTIIAWHKAEGDRVVKGELLCDIEAAKTTVEFESPESGILKRIIVALNQNVPVDTVIAEIDPATGDERRMTAGHEGSVSPANQSETLKDDGQLARASPLAKHTAELPKVALEHVEGTGANGRVRRDDDARVGFDDSQIARQPVQVEPRARKAARDLGVNLDDVIGSGPGGRIVAEDIIVAPPQVTEAPPAPPAPPSTTSRAESAASPDIAEYSEVPHSMMRRTVARRLTESKQSVPHFYVKASCRIDALLALRTAINATADVKVSVNDFIIKAVALALFELPDANVAWGEKAMRRFTNVDVAVAVATPRGLVTPIVRQANAKTIRQIAAEVKALASRGRESKLKPEEYQGGSTSVSNLGMFGVEEFSAILNPPQSTIFAIGAAEQRVIVVDGEQQVATMMAVTISVDHRAIDGSIAAQLLGAFKRLVESPIQILA